MCEFKEFLWCICNHHTKSKEQCDKQKWKRRGSSAARRISNVSRPSISTFGRKMSFSSQSSAAKGIERVGANGTSSTSASNRSSSSGGAFCNPGDRKIRLTYMSDICPSCVATFREAGIGHVHAQERVRDWNIKNNYSGPIKLDVATNGFVSIVGYTLEEIAELGRVHTGQTDSMNTTNTTNTANTSNSANASRETSPEKSQRTNSTPWRRDVEREAAAALPHPEDFVNAFRDIELDENIDAAKQKEKQYADYVRQVGSNDAKEERKEKERKKTADAEEERKEMESKERERKKKDPQTQRRAELFAQAYPRGVGDSDLGVREMGDVRTTRRAVQTTQPPRVGSIRANTMEVDKRRDHRPVPGPVRAKTSFPYSNRVPAPRGPTKPKVKTRKGDAYGDAYDDAYEGDEQRGDSEQGVQLRDFMRVQQPQRRPTNRIFEQNNHRDNEERHGMSRQAQRRPTNNIARQLSSADNENEQQRRGMNRRYQTEQIPADKRLHQLSFEDDDQRDQKRGMTRHQAQGWPVNGRIHYLDEDEDNDQEQDPEMSKGQTQRRKVPRRTREMNDDDAQERGMARRQSQPVMLSSNDVLLGWTENESRPHLVERNTHATAFKHHLMTEEQAEERTTRNAVLLRTSSVDVRPQLQERDTYAAEPRRHLMTDEEELQEARNILMSGAALVDARPHLSEKGTCNDAYGDGYGFGRQLTSSPQQMRSSFDAGDDVTPTRANFQAGDLLSGMEREGRGRELSSLAQRSPIPKLGTPTLTDAPGSRFEQGALSLYGISASLTPCRDTACGETSWTV